MSPPAERAFSGNSLPVAVFLPFLTLASKLFEVPDDPWAYAFLTNAELAF